MRYCWHALRRPKSYRGYLELEAPGKCPRAADLVDDGEKKKQKRKKKKRRRKKEDYSNHVS